MKVATNRLDYLYKTTVVLLALGFILYIGAYIISPLLFSFFIALLLYPYSKKLENNGIGRITSSVLLTILFCFTVLVVVFLAGMAITSFLKDVPDITDKFKTQISFATNYFEDLFHLKDGGISHSISKNSSSLMEKAGTMVSSVFESTSSVLNFIALCPIYILLMLLYRKNLKQFVLRVSTTENRADIFDAFHKILEVIKSYITGVGLVIVIIAVLNTTLLTLLGIEHAFLIGVVTSFLTVIPYIGTFIGGILTVLITIATKDSMVYPVLVFCGYTLIQFLEGNFITPKIVGDQVNINPLVAIVSLVIGGSLWGIIGMILSLPVAATIRITFNHIDSLRPFALLMQTHIDKAEKTE